MDSVLTCLVNDTLGPGERSRDLVHSVAEVIGLAGGVAVRESHRALSLAIGLLDLPSGSGIAIDVLAPAHYRDSIESAGHHPVFVDVEPNGVCIDPAQIEKSGADAAIVRTTYGFVPDMKSVSGLGLPCVEDITQGMAANTGDQRVGRSGRAVILGLEPDALITAGGGALVLASKKADAERLGDSIGPAGATTLLPDMNAALGLTQVREIERFVSRREELASLFLRAIMRGRHTAPSQTGDAQNIHFSFPVLVEGSAAEVRQYARKKGVDTELAFADSLLARNAVGSGDNSDGDVAAAFPNARSLTLRCVRFPLYPALTGREADTISRVLSTLP